MNIRDDFLTILLFIMFWLILITLVILMGMDYYNFEKNKCLKEIAKDYCEERNLVFEKNYFSEGFSCSYEREIKLRRFKFTEEELGGCLK